VDNVSAATLLARAGLAGAASRPRADEPSATSGAKRPATAAGPRPLVPPVAQSSVYVFDSLRQVDEVWDGNRPGHVYRRLGHPNQVALEEVVAALEGAEEAAACASGMGALYGALVAHVGAGDAVVAQKGLYGGTETLLKEELSKQGVRTILAEAPTAEAFRTALSRLEGAPTRPRVLLVETLSNPTLTVAALPGLVLLAAERELLLVVDNTLATPLGCRPLKWGDALVVHSATKYLNGHSDVVGGIAAGPARLIGPVREVMKSIGLTMAPLEAWLTLRGLRTLHLRFPRQQETAAAVAAWLEGRAGVGRVFYPGLESHPSRDVARRVLDGFGAMVSFELTGGEEAVRAFVERLELITFSPSFGETATTVTYPARTSHRALGREEREAAGARPGLVRMSVGLEEASDILADLKQALGG